jgi:hypothetical protein
VRQLVTENLAALGSQDDEPWAHFNNVDAGKKAGHRGPQATIETNGHMLAQIRQTPELAPTLYILLETGGQAKLFCS